MDGWIAQNWAPRVSVKYSHSHIFRPFLAGFVHAVFQIGPLAVTQLDDPPEGADGSVDQLPGPRNGDDVGWAKSTSKQSGLDIGLKEISQGCRRWMDHA